MRFGNYFKLYNILDSLIMNLVGGWSDKPNLKGETEATIGHRLQPSKKGELLLMEEILLTSWDV